MSKSKGRAAQVPTAGQYAYAGLERAIHEKARLGILTSLTAQPAGVSFNDLKLLCDLTDGNLNRHLDVLVTEGLVVVEKLGQAAGRAKTMCYLTPVGRERFLAYLQELNRVVSDAASAAAAAQQTPAPTNQRLGWSAS